MDEQRRGVVLRRVVVGLVVVLSTIVYLWPALGTLRTYAATDILHHAAPYRESRPTEGETDSSLQHDQMAQTALVAEFWDGVREGRLQLWEPDHGGGMPLFTGVHNRVLVPWFVTFLIAPLALGTTFAMAIAFVVVQLGTYGLARRLGLSWSAALLAAVAYAFSGPVTVFVLRIHEAFLLPAVLWALHGALTDPDRRGRFLVATSLLMAGVWFSGFPAAGFFVLYTAAAFTAVLAWQLTADRRREAAGEPGEVEASDEAGENGEAGFAAGVRAQIGGWLGAGLPAGIAVAAGTAIAAVQLLPTFEFIRTAGGVGRRIPLDYAAGLAKLSTAVSGRFFGTYRGDTWWSPQQAYANPVEAQSTVGAVPLALIVAVAVIGLGAAISLLRRRRAGTPAHDEAAPAAATATATATATAHGGPTPGRAHHPTAAPPPVGARRDDPDRIVATVLLPTSILVAGATYLGGAILAAVQVLPFMATNSVGRARFVVALSSALVAGWGLDLLRERVAVRRSARGDRSRGDPIGATAHAASTRSRRRAAYRIAAAVQLLVCGAALAVGLVRGLSWAQRLNELDVVIDAVTLPLVVLALAVAVVALAAWTGRVRHPALGLLLAGLVAVELQWGAWEITPASPRSLFYPEHPAVERIEDEVGPGGQYRFLSRSGNVLPPHAGALLDVTDIRAEYPVFGPYEDLIVTADPAQEPSGVRVILKPTFSEELELDSPILDALAGRLLIESFDSDPLQPGEGITTELDGGELPLEREVQVPDGRLRGVSLELAPTEEDCRSGWVEMEAAGRTTRRLVRDLGDETWFHLPDLEPDGERLTFQLRATDCPVELLHGEAYAVAAQPDALPLRSVAWWLVHERPDALPRAALADTTLRIDGADERLAYLAQRQPGDPVVLSATTEPTDADGERDAQDATVAGGGDAEQHAGGTVRFLADDPDRVALAVNARGAGMLVLRDVAAPGWRVTVDGQPAELLVADHAFRAVRVPPGTSQVVFTYRPTSLWVGLAASLVGAASTVALGAWGYRRRRHGQRPGR